MAAHVLVDKNVNKANLPFAIRGEITDEQVKELQEKGFANGVAKGEVSGRHGFAWVTTTYAIEQLRASTPSDRLPSKVRNLAGLMHLDDEEHLVEIKYPLYSPVVSNLAAPTFLEGCPSRIFRCCHSSTGWGRTVDLDTLNDGLPEAVHPPVPFTEEFHLLDIGRLDASCPPYDEAAFERTLPHPWLNDSIREVAEYVR
jgi:hypothetical protein